MATFGCECEACQAERAAETDHDENDDRLSYEAIDGTLVMRIMVLSGVRDEDGEPSLMLDQTFNPLVGHELLRKLYLHARDCSLYGFLAQRLMHGQVRAGDLAPFSELVEAIGDAPTEDMPENDPGEPGEQGEGDDKGTVH